MKILHYAQTYKTCTETFIYDQVRLTVAKGNDVKVCTRRCTNLPRVNPDCVCITGRVNFIRPNYLRFLYNWPGLYQFTLATQQWKQILDTFSPDIIHCHFGWSLIDVLPVLEKLNNPCPVLASLHGTDVTQYPRLVKTYKSLLKCYPYNIQYTVPSNFLKKEVMKTLSIESERVAVLPNMVNKKFSCCKAASFRKGEQLKIVNIGRLVPVKGQQYLVMALAKLVQDYYENTHLTLVGTGKELKNIRKLVNQYSLDNHVTIISELTHDEIPGLLANCHIYVQPSIHDSKTNQSESFGLSVVEAISIGLPVIVTDTGGLKETVLSGQPDSAIIVREKNPDDIYKALTRIIDNGVRQDRFFRKRVVDTYSEKTHGEKLMLLYESLLQ